MHCKTRLDLFFWHEDPRWMFRDTRGCVVFRVFRVCFPFVRGVPGVGFRFSGRSWCSGGVFDTPVFACVSNGFGGVRVGRGCVCAGVGVSFSLAARHGVLAPWGWCFRSGAVVV